MTFHGVRGSTPSPCEANRRYGGNTSSVAVDIGDGSPILLDLGTGVRPLGAMLSGPFVGTIFVTHLHWDHVQGLPFFAPLLEPDSSATIYGPAQTDGSLAGAIEAFIRPPYFPVALDELPCSIDVVEIGDESVNVGSATVMARSVPHVGDTNGYRIDHGGSSVAYIPDHQQPEDAEFIDPNVEELCDSADLLIHDAQYTPAEFVQKSTWGHCTIDYAIHVASSCRVRKLVLFHHDPAHGDDMLDELSAAAAERGAASGVEVVAAYESMSLDV